MAHWQTGCIVPQHQSTLESLGAHTDRALQNTSGNVQSYSDNLADSGAVGRDDQLQQLAFKYPQPPAPTHPVPTVPTTLQPPQNLRLQSKKLRRLHSFGPSLIGPRSRPRSYLRSNKYLEYRSRPRRDTGKDGEPVWSDELEDAFQQGGKLSVLRVMHTQLTLTQLSRRIRQWADGNGPNEESHMVEMSSLLNSSSRKLVSDELESKCPATSKSSTRSSRGTPTVSCPPSRCCIKCLTQCLRGTTCT